MTGLPGSRHFVLAAILALGACQQPTVELKPPAAQQSAVTVRDWNTVAVRIADGMQRSGLLGGVDPATGQVAASGPFYVHVVADGSAFLRSVRDALVSEILDRGGAVSVAPAGATIVNIDVDWVRWGNRPLGPKGGTGTALGGTAALGLLLADAAPISLQGAAALALGAGIAADVIAAITPYQGSEAAWRAYIVTPTRVVWQRRGAMYVDTSDLPLYQTGTRTAPMPSPGPSLALVTQPLRYVR